MNTINYKLQHTEAIKKLIQIDPDLDKIIKQVGLPKYWTRPNSFASIIQLILEQQVSLASAKAVYEKLLQIDPVISPITFQEITDSDLRLAGFSKQKILYCRIIADEVISRKLNFDKLSHFTDDQVRDKFMSIKGIGKWTADCYLIFYLNRTDIWPASDLALNKALCVIKKLNYIPNHKRSYLIAKTWKPWRSSAARLLWHFYLSKSFP